MVRTIALVLASVCISTVALAQLGQRTPGEAPSLSDATVPVTYEGGDTRISINLTDTGDSNGEIMGVFGNNGERATVAQLWWGDGGAGGVQANYNWLWGMNAQQAKERPGDVTIARWTFAIDQNAAHDRKFTVGLGFEREPYFFDAYLSGGANSTSNDASVSAATGVTSKNVATMGAIPQATSTDQLFDSRPYSFGIGLSGGHFSAPLTMRSFGGLNYQKGQQGAHQATLSFGIDKYIGRRGWSLSALAEHTESSGPLEPSRSDDRVSVFLRYEFGGTGVFVPTSETSSPAWIQRALRGPSTGHSRTVETYRARPKPGRVTPPVAHAPIAVNDTASVARDSSNNAINVLANDSDPDGDALIIIQVSSPAHGSAVIAGSLINYTPTPGFVGSDAFTYTISDGHGGNATASVAITVTAGPNRPPTSTNPDITVTTQPGSPVTINLLATVHDPDGDPLSVASLGTPMHGTVHLNPDGSVVYTPDPGYSGSDRFTYTISDGHGGVLGGTVTITVTALPNRPPTANNDAASTAMDTAVSVPVLANDSDPDGDVLTVTAVGTPAHGTATLNDNGVTYTPSPGYTGSDSFPYTISDGRGHSATATVTITVTPIPNRPPTANNDTASTAMDTAVSVPVLANDSDPDGDVLTVTSVGAPGNGTATLNGSSVTYTPNPGYTGSDSFPYTISDGRGHSATATVTITVTPIPNRPPTANNDSASTAMDTAVSVPVLANDSDPDGDVLTVTSVGAPAHGTATLNGNSVTYTPNPGYTGSDSFPYTISDGRGHSATATVTITVTPIPNRPPTANNDSASTAMDTAVSVPVLANDSDPDGDVLTVTSVGTPANGTATLNGNSVTYTPTQGFTGSDAFSYTISDGHGHTATATVTITVTPIPNRPPTANNDSASTAMDTAVSVPVLANDSDPDGDVLTMTAVGTPAHGTATLSGNNVTYTPNPGYTGTESFPYTISDGHGHTASATVTITVTPIPNRPPTANNDAATTSTSATITVNVLANDSDPDGDPLSVISATQPTHGSRTLNSNGSIAYTAQAGFVGTDTFGYTISDGHGHTASATVTITVTPDPNQPPVANDDDASTSVGLPVMVNVLANDTDADNDPLFVTAVGTPAHGTAGLTAAGIVTYTPQAGFIGSDSFSYTINDGHGHSASASVHVTVTAVPNQPPIAVDDNASTSAGMPVTIAVLANDSDPDNDPLTVIAVTSPGAGTASINGNGSVTYTPEGAFIGSDTFGYTISDGHGHTASATVHVTVTAAPNQPPVAVDDNASTSAGIPVAIPVLANDSDPDNDPLTVIAVTSPGAGTASINGNGSVTYAPEGAFVGSDTFGYTISDGHGHTASATVHVTVTAAPNQPPIANNDDATTASGAPVVIDVLGNDSDPDGDPLTVISVTAPLLGSATINANGTVTYTSQVGLFGPDTFTYTISDGHGHTASASIHVNVVPIPNQPPIAQDDMVTMANTLPSIVIDVLANDSDPDGDPLTVISVSTPNPFGTAQINVDNTVTFTSGPQVGLSTFTYTISDGHGHTATAQVSVLVGGP